MLLTYDPDTEGEEGQSVWHLTAYEVVKGLKLGTVFHIIFTDGSVLPLEWMLGIARIL